MDATPEVFLSMVQMGEVVRGKHVLLTITSNYPAMMTWFFLGGGGWGREVVCIISISGFDTGTS